MAKALDNEMRQFILTRLSTGKTLTFNKLFAKRFYSSSQFTYHLNWLVSKGYVAKTSQGYRLGIEGKRLITYVTLGKEIRQPLLVVAAILRRNDMILTSKSMKEPIVGLWGLSCFGKYGALKEVVRRETGYSLQSYAFHGVYDIRTTDLDLHHILFVYASYAFTGSLRPSSMRASQWVTRKQLHALKQYPENEFILDHPGHYAIERNIEEKTYSLKSF